MTSDERQALEARADRALRRGELSDAFALLRQLAQAFPRDEGLKARIAQLEENLQPAELLNPRSNFAAEPDGRRTPTEEAEALAERGDYAGAITIYRRLLAERPGSDLLSERLTELFRLVQAQARKPSPAKVREAALNELLQRIASRRRG